MDKSLTRLIAISALLLLGACTYRAYPIPEPQEPQSAERPVQTHENNDRAEENQESPAVTQLQCPDVETVRLILAGEFFQAKQLLNEDLERSTDELQRSCILSTMGLLAALPESDYFDIERAQDFQSLAQVNGVVQRGGIQLQLLDRNLRGLIALQQKYTDSEAEVERLQQELEKKESALKKLKKLTLGSQ